MTARDVCDTCPVRRSCLAHALVVNEPHGIWGGFDESERAWLRLALAEGKADGVSAANSTITVRQAVEDWLTYGLPRRSAATVDKYKIMAAKVIYRPLGARKLRDLSAAEVDRWLARLATTLSTRTLRELRSILSRAVSRAMARDLVRATSSI